MRYGSVCSGIEAATVAWHHLGWEPAFFSEIEKFPRSVLSHHYPAVPLHGDFTTIEKGQYGSIELLVGGTPCQSFSIAGLRKGLDDDRGNLALEYLRLAQRETPKWLVWENVPGVLSSNGGRDFGAFLGALAELGYGFAYRVLDAQYFGVAQRRRRVFVVGYAGDWRRAAQVLFERESMSGNPAPSREPRQKDSREFIPSVANCLTQRMHKGMNTTLDEGQTPLAFMSNANACAIACAGDDMSPSMQAQGDPPAVAFAENQRAELREMECVGAITAEGGKPGNGYPAIRQSMVVRKLTPIECERLQGFPDNYTLVGDKCFDGPRYKALGNSMAVPVMRWIGERIAKVEAIP